MAYFLWLKASITDTILLMSLKKFFNHWLAIQHYSIIESYQFEHLLDYLNNF